MNLPHNQEIAIAEKHIGPIGENGNIKCPGEHLHTSDTKENHCRIYFNDELPQIDCFHASCLEARETALKAIWRDFGLAKKGLNISSGKPKSNLAKAPEKKKEAKRNPLNEDTLAQVLLACPEKFTYDDFRSRSPIPIPDDPQYWAKLMMDALFKKGDCIIIFTEFESQGRFIYKVGYGLYVLGKEPGVPAQPTEQWPKAGSKGVWWLNHPVTGLWLPTGETKKDGTAKMSRRSGRNGTRFPYLVLESDTISEDKWLRILAWLEVPIVTIYTSGGKSIHALIRLGAYSIEQFKMRAAPYISRLSILGADAAAMTPNRLTRLPGCVRLYGKDKNGKDVKLQPPPMQKLLYLSPFADGTPIMDIQPERNQDT